MTKKGTAVLLCGSALLLACDGEYGEVAQGAGSPAGIREQVVKQLELLRLPGSNADACAQSGLLASVADGRGRYVAFCGDGTVLQGSVATVEPLSLDALALYLEVAPAGAPVPRALAGQDPDRLIGRRLVDGPVVVTDPAVRELDLHSSLAAAPSCGSIDDQCEIVAAWADEPIGGDVSWGQDWCRTDPVTWSQRTASAQLGGVGNFVQGKQYVRACSGQSAAFEGHHRNPCTGAWDETFQWNTGPGGFLHMKLGQRFHPACDKKDTDLRFTTSGGSHRYTGAFRAGAVL